MLALCLMRFQSLCSKLCWHNIRNATSLHLVIFLNVLQCFLLSTTQALVQTIWKGYASPLLWFFSYSFKSAETNSLEHKESFNFRKVHVSKAVNGTTKSNSNG